MDMCEGSGCTPSRLEKEYVSASRPVLLPNASGQVVLRTKEWRRKQFLRRWGRVPFQLPFLPRSVKALAKGRPTPPIAVYLKSVRANATAWRAGDASISPPISWNGPQNRSLHAHLGWPVALDSFGMRDPTFDRLHFRTFLGPQRSGTAMHYHQSNWNLLFHGLKLWVITPPAHSIFHADHHAATSFERGGWLEEALGRADGTVHPDSSPRRYCIQREGDVVFLPSGWAHATLNLRESIGVANFLRSVIEDELSYRAEPLVHTRRGIGSLQTAACLNEDTDIFS
uniref:JmjC domain-containing protein n=1 Tax=Haptolina ericina TaxID=156174 RepID=A0A7S3AFK9_9EUKA